MEPLIRLSIEYSTLMVPVIALASIIYLYATPSNQSPAGTTYFLALILIAFLTIRTMLSNDNCWLFHTTSLGIMVVAGVMRAPSENDHFGITSRHQEAVE